MIGEKLATWSYLIVKEDEEKKSSFVLSKWENIYQLIAHSLFLFKKISEKIFNHTIYVYNVIYRTAISIIETWRQILVLILIIG